MNKATEQILKGSAEAGKTYEFNEAHSNNEPAQWWFQDSDQGLTLFVVFYSQACRWAKCLGCNLPSVSSVNHVDYKAIINQINFLFELPEVKDKREDIAKLIVSNNGSVLDQETFSSTALMYLMAMVNLNLPNLKEITLETRPEYVEVEELEFLKRALNEGDTPTQLELAIGFEAFNCKVRNDVFLKGMDLPKFEHFIQTVAPYKYKVKCYFMQKPVSEFSHQDGIDDIRAAIDYLSSIATKYGVEINLHLNPTYVAKGTKLEEEFHSGSYTPPLLSDVAKAVSHGHGKGITIFVGLFDEDLAVDGGSFIREGDEEVIQMLESFNKSQDYSKLT